jgi:hypothetical protein
VPDRPVYIRPSNVKAAQAVEADGRETASDSIGTFQPLQRCCAKVSVEDAALFTAIPAGGVENAANETNGDG